MSSGVGTSGQAGSVPSVATAFELGWHMAELYARDIARQQPAIPAAPPSVLPGLSALSKHERDQILAAQIAAEVRELEESFSAAGLTAPDTAAVQCALTNLSRSEADVRVELVRCHKTLLTQLWAADFRLGKAYSLGRALADTTLRPRAADPASLTTFFKRERVHQLVRWLDDLATGFPTSSAEAVGNSLEAWTRWVAERSPEAISQYAGGGSLDRRLRAQGRLWRALLSNEKRPEDLLSAGDYVHAAQEVTADAARLAASFIRRWKYVFGLTLLMFAGAVVGLAFLLQGRSQTVAIVTTIVAGAGLSWKGVGSTLGATLRLVEQPVWRAEVARAAAVAATMLPPNDPGAAVPDSDPRNAEGT